MPRPSALASVTINALQAEIQRRVSKLPDLLKLRDQVDKDIAELQAPPGPFVNAAPAGAKIKVARKKRRKGPRGRYDLTAPDFILSLLAGGETLTTAELKTAWTNAGRGSKVDNALTALVKTGLVRRAKVKNGQGSKYSLAAGRMAVGKPQTKPAAKKQPKRKTFSVTAEQFILGLLKGKTLTTRQLAEAWRKAGRGGTVDSDLSYLVKAGQLKRESLGHKKGSNYNLA